MPTCSTVWLRSASDEATVECGEADGPALRKSSDMMAALPTLSAAVHVTMESAPRSPSQPVYPQCVQGVTCIPLIPYSHRSLIFDCAAVNTSQRVNGNVYFMHGNDGPRSKGMYALMMQAVAAHGYNVLACDQRGFSPRASPYNESEYNYDLLVDDIFAIVDRYFGAGGKFHVVAHDQGARVAWHALAGSMARSRFASYTSLSIPHLDAFSTMMYGSNPEPKQQLQYAYVRMLTLPNSVKAYNNNIWNHICQGAYGYETPEACQPAMWWYNGAYAAGAIALQPFTGFGPIGKEIGIPETYVKDHSPYSLAGFPQRSKIGNITELPVQYICGVGEVADLCNDRARDETAKYVAKFTYKRMSECGHCLTDPGLCPQYQDVIDAVVEHIEAADAGH